MIIKLVETASFAPHRRTLLSSAQCVGMCAGDINARRRLRPGAIDFYKQEFDAGRWRKGDAAFATSVGLLHRVHDRGNLA